MLGSVTLSPKQGIRAQENMLSKDTTALASTVNVTENKHVVFAGISTSTSHHFTDVLLRSRFPGAQN